MPGVGGAGSRPAKTTPTISQIRTSVPAASAILRQFHFVSSCHRRSSNAQVEGFQRSPRARITISAMPTGRGPMRAKSEPGGSPIVPETIRASIESAALRPRSIGRDDAADSRRGRLQDPLAVFDGAHLRHLRVLIRARRFAEPRVVGCDDQKLRAALNLGMHDSGESRFPADQGRKLLRRRRRVPYPHGPERSGRLNLHPEANSASALPETTR